MDAKRSLYLGLTVGALAAVLTGCLFPTPPPTRTNNQGGGNLVTFGLKTAQGSLTTTTPDEWQLLFDTISESTPNLDIELSDEQAAVVVDFLGENNLDSIQDIRDLVEQAEHDPSSVEIVIPDSLTELIDSGVDVDEIAQHAG